MRAFLIAILCLTMGVTVVSAQTIQARLIKATFEEQPANPNLHDIVEELKTRFGYPHYQLMGRETGKLKADKPVRIDLGQGFVVFVTDRTGASQSKRREVKVDWYSSKTLLVTFETKISPKGAILVKGPEVGKDWIVLALSLAD